MVNPERVFHLVQQAGDGIGGNTDSYLIEKASDLAGGSATPLQSGDRVAGSVVLEKDFDGGDYFGRFFSTGFRPPPDRRTRRPLRPG